MKTLLLAATCTLLLFCACRQQCSLPCSSVLELDAVGYPFYELDTVTVDFYAPDGTFSHLQSSQVLTKYMSDTLPAWAYNAFGVMDTTADTLHSFTFGCLVPYGTLGSDILATIHSTGRVYRFTSITFSNRSETHPCSDMPPACSCYLASYNVDGNTVKCSPSAEPSYLYLQK